MPIIELKDVSKIYKLGEIKVNALKDVSLKIKSGEVLSIMGASGSGKSTMLNMIGALDKPTKGKVFVKGKDISKMTENELAVLRGQVIGFVFQFFYLIPNLTGVENVELPMMFLNKPNRKERAEKLMKMVGLEKRADFFPRQLSGGERQRVAIARALANNPDVILADEPTGNLDSKTGKDIMDLLAKLNKKEKKTVILITHDSKVAKYAKRKIYLRDGEIIRGR